ncbi:MAG: hypothetical protein ACK559_32985, partial [bacterium]
RHARRGRSASSLRASFPTSHRLSSCSIISAGRAASLRSWSTSTAGPLAWWRSRIASKRSWATSPTRGRPRWMRLWRWRPECGA